MIPYARQSINQEDVDAVCEVLRSDWLTQGPKVREFEEALARECGARHCVAVANGTVALHLACLALGVGPGDVGLTSPISFLASANCVAYCGGRPDFADVDPATLCLSPERVEEYCRTRGIPKVVIPVDFAGVPADLPKFRGLSEKYGFKLIEDAAHSFGSTYRHEGKDYACGSCAHTDMAILSFHPVKTITTGEGGAVLTNDDALAATVRRLANHGMERNPKRFGTRNAERGARNAELGTRNAEVQHTTAGQDITRHSSLVTFESPASSLQPPTSTGLPQAPPWYYEMQDLGFNARITDIQCALGLSQLKRIGQFKARRQEIVRGYNQAFEDLTEKGIVLLPPWPQDTDPCYHLYVLRLGAACGISRDDFFFKLRDKGIYCQVHYIPIYRQPYYHKRHGYDPSGFPESEKYYASCLSLPLFPDMDEGTQKHVVDCVYSLMPCCSEVSQ